MNWLLDMALRNTRRNRRRTVLATISIGLSVMLITFLGGFVGGVLGNMVRNITKNDTGHIRIVTRGFEERERFMPLDELVARPQEVLAAIEALPELSGQLTLASERILFGTLLSNGSRSKAAFAVAGDIEREKQLINLDRSIVEGRYLAGSGEAILGTGLAKDLGLSVGERLRVVTTGADGALRFKSFAIVGLFTTSLNELDSTAFQVPLEDAKTFLRTEGGSQRLLVMIKDYRKAAAVAAIIQRELDKTRPELVARPWTEIGDFGGLILMMERLYYVIYIFIAFLGAFIITNILMMVVLERRKEIGILKSLGLRRGEVQRLFLAEGAMMGLVGSGVGALLGFGLCVLTSIYGIDFSAAMGAMTFPMDPVFYSRVDPLQALLMFLLGVAVSVAVSIAPSRRAATMNAVDAIKSAF